MLFKHKYITAPTVTPADAIVKAAKELEDVIKNKIPPPFAKSGIDRLKECNAPTFLARISQPRRRRRVRILRGWAPRRMPHLRGWKERTSPMRKCGGEQIKSKMLFGHPKPRTKIEHSQQESYAAARHNGMH